MKKKSISDKAFLVLLFGTIVMVLLSSCTSDEYFTEINSECNYSNTVDLSGDYAWSLNENLVVLIRGNNTLSYVQDGILNGTSSFCVTIDGNYLRLVNEFSQVSYVSFSLVDNGGVQGIVLDGEFYELLNN